MENAPSARWAPIPHLNSKLESRAALPQQDLHAPVAQLKTSAGLVRAKQALRVLPLSIPDHSSLPLGISPRPGSRIWTPSCGLHWRKRGRRREGQREKEGGTKSQSETCPRLIEPWVKLEEEEEVKVERMERRRGQRKESRDEKMGLTARRPTTQGRTSWRPTEGMARK